MQLLFCSFLNPRVTSALVDLNTLQTRFITSVLRVNYHSKYFGLSSERSELCRHPHSANLPWLRGHRLPPSEPENNFRTSITIKDTWPVSVKFGMKVMLLGSTDLGIPPGTRLNERQNRFGRVHEISRLYREYNETHRLALTDLTNSVNKSESLILLNPTTAHANSKCCFLKPADVQLTNRNSQWRKVTS
jgi:hypothetical protein